MPQAEDEVKNSHVSNSPAKVAGMWQKFHFSGRVIMCSVLFGLGLILIGGLIFAINVDDDTNLNKKNDETAGELPTKAPSNYVGPVVMGIGGFIVIVGVIMCMFETQICRKKTADSKPLISDKNEDVEVKVSDSTQTPSSSHCHKNHKHKSRKASPRKTKSKHSKSHDQKLASSKSPPISIDKSKSFMTSSEENFLTPPNTLSEHAALEPKNSKEVEIQTSSSLMKSFTSSGTWNQSTEFLTPTASYKEDSVSVDNSVDLDEKHDQVNFKTNEVPSIDYTSPEYMTPLTAGEERIQEMFTQVKNDQMKSDLEILGEKETAVNVSSEHGTDNSVINTESKVSENVENIKIPKNQGPLDVNYDTSAVKETTDKPAEAILNVFEKDEIGNEENTFSDNISSISSISSEKITADKDEAECESADISTHAHKTFHSYENEENTTKDIPSSHNSTNEKPDSFLPHDSLSSHLNETKNDLTSDPEPSNEKVNESNMQLDLESSASSEETLVSPDNSTEKPKINDAQTVLSMTEENSSYKSKTSTDSESSKADQSSHISDHRNSLTDTLKSEKVGASDLTDKESDSKETENIDEKSTEKSS